MLQRRFASSIYAVRRSLERMQDKREKILEDPGGVPAGADRQAASRRLRRSARRRAAGDHRRARRRRRLRRSGGAAGGDRRARQARSTRRSCSKSARSRSKLVKLREVLTEQGHLRRPEDEAPGLHRAQGHARLPGRRRQGRPAARQAARVGPHRHPDPRRHEDRRPRHAGHAASTPSASSARTARCWLPPRRPAKASTSSSAG